MILSIETATQVCSVTLSKGKEIICCLESEEKNAHSRVLNALIDRLFKESGTTLTQLSAIAVSKGPGSYTGLRIGVSTAKGFCYAKDLPLIGINTLEGMSYGMKHLVDSNKPTLLVPMIDARRMEVYMALYDQNLQPVKETTAEIIHADSFSEYRDYNLYLGGDGADKCKSIVVDANIHFLDDFKASANFLLIPALEAFEAGRFEDTAYFEPFYLKDFIAGKPRVKGL